MFSKFLTGWLLPPSVSVFGPRVDSIYYFILWVTGLIFVGTEIALIWFSWRYRRQEGKKAYYTHGKTTVEIIWTTIPAMILVYMGIASQTLWSELRQPSQFPANALQVRVLAEQWLWHFRYPGPDGRLDTEDDITVDNSFHVPIDKPVRFDVTAQDVIHGFYLPDLRVHQDAVPGLTSIVWLQANKLGNYDLRCTQFCGTNHYQMKGEIVVDKPEDFQAWLASSKASAF
jgi:cytochrome c oxidase subunit 2